MDLRVGTFPAEIAVEAGDPRRRLVAPAVVFESLAGDIERPFVARENARNALLQRLSNVWRINAREVLGRERLHHGRNLVAVEAEPGYRRSGDNLEGGNLGCGCGR